MLLESAPIFLIVPLSDESIWDDLRRAWKPFAWTTWGCIAAALMVGATVVFLVEVHSQRMHSACTAHAQHTHSTCTAHAQRMHGTCATGDPARASTRVFPQPARPAHNRSGPDSRFLRVLHPTLVAFARARLRTRVHACVYSCQELVRALFRMLGACSHGDREIQPASPGGRIVFLSMSFFILVTQSTYKYLCNVATCATRPPVHYGHLYHVTTCVWFTHVHTHPHIHMLVAGAP